VSPSGPAQGEYRGAHHEGSPGAAVAIRNLHKAFGPVRALDGVDFDVREGEFFGLLGPNGAGKTTLISILAGLTRADSGSATVMAHDVVADYRAARRSLGVVPQELVFDPFFTVRETLRFQSGYFGLRHNDDWIDEILANLDLTSKANANMRSLSGGMKRRVLVGQALVHKPPVIVLDEPTAGVDVALRQSLWAFIRKLNSQGHTIILTTHYLEEAEELCGRIAMLNHGRLIALEDKQTLLHGYAGVTVRITSAAAPSAFAAKLARREGDVLFFRLASYAELEQLLAAYRLENLRFTDLAVQEADLEDVFLRMVGAPA
jgi:ABC-2 type transport system ATP-binding protein